MKEQNKTKPKLGETRTGKHRAQKHTDTQDLNGEREQNRTKKKLNLNMEPIQTQ